MPYVFEFDQKHRVIRCTMTGPITDGDLLEYYKEAARYAEQTNALAGILDFTGVTIFNVSAATVQTLASFDPAMPDPERPRFIVAPSNHIYGMSRMYQIMGEPTRPALHVVRSLEDVYAALGIKEPDFKPLAIS
jgi:hypothetical protein